MASFFARRSVVGVFVAICCHMLVLGKKQGDVEASVTRTWNWVGPFSIGKAERGADVMMCLGGIRNVSTTATTKYPSEYAQGGRVSWETVDAPGGQVSLPFKLGGNAFYGWAVGSLTLNRAECLRVRVSGTVWESFLGERAIGTEGIQVELEAGTYPLYVKARGEPGGVQFRVEMVSCGPKEGSLRLLNMVPGDWQWGHTRWTSGPPTCDLPDVVGGQLMSEIIHVRVVNDGRRFAKDVTLHVQGSKLIAPSSSAPMPLAPGQTAPLVAPLRLHAENVTEVSDADCPLKVQLLVEGGGLRLEKTVQLRCRKVEESFLMLFVDFDGSPQAAGVRAPSKPCTPKKPKKKKGNDDVEDARERADESAVGGQGIGGCPILLSFHGMDVTGQRQADAYKQKKDLWVLAPHGRGSHAFNWHGPGYWSALTALHALRSRSRSFLSGRYPAAQRAVLATGHSNGGFAALLFATHFPDITFGIAPLAGMPALGESGQGQFVSHVAEPSLQAIFDSSVGESRADLLIGNVAGIPFLARTGAKDEVISPFLTRRISRMVWELTGSHGKMKESTLQWIWSTDRSDGFSTRSHDEFLLCSHTTVPGKGHWWWDSKSEMDGGAVDDEEMRKFWSSALKQSTHGSDAAGAPMKGGLWTDDRTMICHQPASCGSLRGLKPVQFHINGKSAQLSVSASGPELRFQTRNVRRLLIEDNALFSPAAHAGDILLVLDGSPFSIKEGEAPTGVFCKEGPGQQWHACNGGDRNSDSSTCNCCEAGQRTPETDGPMRRAFARRMICVYGTEGPDVEREAFLQTATQLAQHWFAQGGGVMQIMSDVEVARREELVDGEEHNLILLGGPESNSVSRKLQPLIPISIVTDKGSRRSNYTVGPCRFDGHDKALVTLGPLGERGLLILATGDALQSFSKAKDILFDGLFDVNYWQHRQPEYVVVGEQYGCRGLKGVLAAGYWGNRWEWVAESSFVSC